MKWLYLLIDLFTVLIPLIFSYHPKLNFYKNWKAFFTANILVATLFVTADIFFTKWGVWGFNPDYVLGIYFFNLPLEELLFFVCIPFACVFTYHCLNLFFKFEWRKNTETIFILLTSSVLLIIGIYYYDRIYTASTFISLPVLLIAIKYFGKVKWLPKLLSIYPVLLIPFFIVNGILTGSGLQHPLVWYNDIENIGLRIFTIPVEDIFYGFELILLNVFLYEYFKNRKKISKLSFN